MWTPQAEKVDRKRNASEEMVTMEAICAMASDVMECLDFTWDSPQQHQDQSMPVLDTAMWIG